jgi:hypothetical protein
VIAVEPSVAMLVVVGCSVDDSPEISVDVVEPRPPIVVVLDDVDGAVELGDVAMEVLVDVEPPVQPSTKNTNVSRVALRPSGHEPWTVSTTQLVSLPATIVVACVVPAGATGELYPVTAAGVFVGPTVAVALTIVIGCAGSVSLFLMVHVTTC